jgi:hypothetical protein
MKLDHNFFEQLLDLFTFTCMAESIKYVLAYRHDAALAPEHGPQERSDQASRT